MLSNVKRLTVIKTNIIIVSTALALPNILFYDLLKDFFIINNVNNKFLDSSQLILFTDLQKICTINTL